MKPQLNQLLLLNKHLRKNAHSIYLDVLRKVLQDHESHDFVKPMLGFIRSRRYDLLWAYADSLSATTYADAGLHLLANQLALLVKKYPWKSSDVQLDPEAKALSTFERSEHRCRRMNQRFHLYRTFRSPKEDLLSRARDWIYYVLGDSPEPFKKRIYDKCDFGPGASLGCHGDATSFGRKVTLPELSVTPGACYYAASALLQDEQLRDRFFDKKVLSNGWEVCCVDNQGAFRKLRDQLLLVQHNKVSFVPKTAKTHRSIAVEPLLNTYIQKGADELMRDLLKRVGLDLSDQSRNQEMARQGSLDRSERGFCTIDLSSASDSVSIGLVRYMLPDQWFEFLNQIRSPMYRLPGSDEDVRYEKFCSMGNGFCFPLQTLLFAALAKASGAGKVGVDFRVYGDDIVVRKSCFEKVVSALNYCGFQVNPQKTFSDGPFRESCGADWYEGIDVRPFTLDFRLDRLDGLFKFVNLARRSPLTSTVLSSGIHHVISVIPDLFQFWRPFKGNPDTGIDPLDCERRSSTSTRFKRSLQCFEWAELETRPIQDRVGVPSWGVMAAALRGHDSKVMFTFRRRTKTTIRFVAYSGATAKWLPN
jgi:hypothetical protein